MNLPGTFENIAHEGHNKRSVSVSTKLFVYWINSFNSSKQAITIARQAITIASVGKKIQSHIECCQIVIFVKSFYLLKTCDSIGNT